MYKIAVIGDRDSVLGFRALGLETCAVETAEDAKKELHRMAKKDYGIIYLTEQYAAKMGDELARYKSQPAPAIILIPGKEGALGLGMANIKTIVERAVGADIL